MAAQTYALGKKILIIEQPSGVCFLCIYLVVSSLVSYAVRELSVSAKIVVVGFHIITKRLHDFQED